MHEHIKPDANLVIGNCAPMHQEELAQKAASSRHGISVSVQGSQDSKWTVKAKKRAEPNAGGRLRKPGPNQWGENEPYSNRGDRKT
jgi:hypothetical protein